SEASNIKPDDLTICVALDQTPPQPVNAAGSLRNYSRRRGPSIGVIAQAATRLAKRALLGLGLPLGQRVSRAQFGLEIGRPRLAGRRVTDAQHASVELINTQERFRI